MAIILVGVVVAAKSPGTSRAGRTVYVSPNGRNSNPCSQSAPCASFGRAYLAASPGDVVQVAGGSYPAQTLPADPTKDAASSLVVFQPAPGASVSLGGFEAGDNRKGVGPKHFELQNMTIAGEVKISWGTQDVTLRNIDAGAINLTATQDVRVLGGDFGPRVDAVSHIKSCAGCPLSQNILIDGATFHDYTISDPANHAECLMVWPGIDITIRNSIFRNCTDFDLLYKPDGLSPGTTVNFTVENDFFDSPMPGNTATVSCDPNCPRGGNALAFADNGNQTWNGVVVRYSSFLAGIRVDPGVTNVLVQANAGVKDKPFNCQSQVTFSYNVWTGATCSATDRMAPLADIFVAPDESSFNLDLKDGSPAIGAGDPSSYPSRDISGHLRPTTFPADAGASQREPALIVPGLAIGTARIGATQAALESFYGPSRRTTKSKLASGSPVVVAEYRVRGGWLLVTYRGPTGVIVATTSRYYRTLKGLGPSAVVAASTSKRTACRPVGAGVGRARMYIRASSGKRPVVTELFVTARGVVPPCAVVKKR